MNNRLSVHRYRRRITQAGLGARVGVSKMAICHYECGRHVPSVYVAQRLAEQLGVTVAELFPLEAAA